MEQQLRGPTGQNRYGVILKVKREFELSTKVLSLFEVIAISLLTDRVVGDLRIHEVLQRSQRPRVVSATHYSDSKSTAPWYHSSDNLYQDQEPAARVTPWHHSTGQS